MLLWNPGWLPDELTIDDLKQKHASHPRNKNLADIFFKAGFIEAWGRGILKIIDSCKAQKLPEPEIQQASGGFQIIFFKDRLTPSFLSQLHLNERQLEAIKLLKKKNRITNRQYQDHFKVSRNTVISDLNDLIEKKLFSGLDKVQPCITLCSFKPARYIKQIAQIAQST